MARPRIAVVLNVGRAHAGEFGGLDQVAQAKGELVEALPAAGEPAAGVAILNADDPRVLAMAARTRARVVTFSAAGSLTPPSRRRTCGSTSSGGRASRCGHPKVRRR